MTTDITPNPAIREHLEKIHRAIRDLRATLIDMVTSSGVRPDWFEKYYRTKSRNSVERMNSVAEATRQYVHQGGLFKSKDIARLIMSKPEHSDRSFRNVWGSVSRVMQELESGGFAKRVCPDTYLASPFDLNKVRHLQLSRHLKQTRASGAHQKDGWFPPQVVDGQTIEERIFGIIDRGPDDIELTSNQLAGRLFTEFPTLNGRDHHRARDVAYQTAKNLYRNGKIEMIYRDNPRRAIFQKIRK